MALKLFGILPTHPMAEKPVAVLVRPLPPLVKPATPALDVPWNTDTQTILEALHELAAGRKSTLVIVRNGTGVSYTVKSFDPETSIARLTGLHKATLSPRMTERENSMYHPRWR